MDAPRRYLEELRGELGFYPTWMPADPIELGAFGTFVRGVFRKDGCLGDLGMDFVAKEHETKGAFKAHRGMKFDVRSDTSAKADAFDASLGITLAADSAYAWAFGAAGARKAEIEDVLQVQSAVLAAWRMGLWNSDWLLVSEVYRVDRLNVVIAKSKNARGELRSKATLPTPNDVLIAHDVSSHFDSSDFFLVENAKRATPLYGLRKLRGLFRKGIAPIRGGGGPDPERTLERAMNESLFPYE